MSKKIIVERRGVRKLIDSFGESIFCVKFPRRTDKIVGGKVVSKAGSLRTMTCKRKPNLKTTKNWTSKGVERPFRPIDKGLYAVYTVEGKNGKDGNGNHWAFIDLKTVRTIRHNRKTYSVVD